jgi:hypothetical protein
VVIAGVRRFRHETRTKRVDILSGNFRTVVPPWPLLISPFGIAFNSPVGPWSKSSALPPCQYSMRYLRAYGFFQTIRTRLTGFSAFISSTTHCGCNLSLSPVNPLVRYGLLFQYLRLGVFTGGSPLVEKPCGEARIRGCSASALSVHCSR